MAWFKFGRKDSFDEFRQAVASSFSYLVTDFGFVRAGETSSSRDAEVAFANDSARVVLGYELDSEPWVYFEVMTSAGRQKVGLHVIVQDRTGSQVLDDRMTAAPSLQSKVQVLADLTQEHAHSLLSGDTSSISRLLKLSAKLMRERNREMFGTSTGETPRFASRPTLAELFADATDDDMKCPRAYQAVWDYEYSTSEISEFLGISPAGVDELLQRWENTT
jgi:hypothetical protein